MLPKIITCSKNGKNKTLECFMKRPAFDDKAEAAARKVLGQIKKNGASAVLEYVKKFDGARLTPAELKVGKAELAAARKLKDPDFKRAVRESRKRVAAFARAGMRKDWGMPTPRGGRLGERFVPLDRVGVYVPGGHAPLVSTVLMTVTLAKVAGVKEIVACTPCGQEGKVDPYLLVAMEEAGATEVYKVGGIQAIGLMAYGTERVRKVQKIVGPGGTFVTAAKRQVYGQVALDLVAGPSEIAVLADSSANPRFVAADLLSQVEHGTGYEKALLVTSSRKLAEGVRTECDRQVKGLRREKSVRKTFDSGVLLVVTKSLEEGMALCNRFAPEHFEILVKKPERWLSKVTCAGAVFLGPWTPEPTGDFVAGPSHVLPTGGAAAMFSGLTVEDFRRRTSVVRFTKKDLRETLDHIRAFARVEGLDAHGRSATIRFDR